MTAPSNEEYDVVVVGSGVAGLATALGLAGLRRVALVTSGALDSGSTGWAQGGLAGALGPDDSAALHATDTMTAGAGVCDATAIRILTDAAPTVLAELLRLGARLDRDAAGRLALTREGGHSTRRVVHAGGDASGAEVGRTLRHAVRNSDTAVIEHSAVRDILTADGDRRSAVTGVALRSADGRERIIRARAVVLATGGVGGLFATSTNPPEVRGTGLGLALRAGASLVDLEYVQFHPTALDIGPATGQVPLISEALRGEGAVLRDERGRSIMAGRHPLADLAPRDVVARRVDEVLSSGGCVRLDATEVADISRRFPTIVASCRTHGIDPATDPIPVTPAQHFLCGGVRTDEYGATDVIGLYAVGETAATGVHGANRLASNSLVEGLVFGRRIAARLALDLPAATCTSNARGAPQPAVSASALPEIRRALTAAAGIRRTGSGLDAATRQLAAMTSDRSWDRSRDAGNEWLAAVAIVAAATERRESRGCHSRGDHPVSLEWWGRRKVVVRLGPGGLPVATTESTEQDDVKLGRTA